MKFIRLETFKDDFKKLPEDIQKQVKEKFLLFKNDPLHPSLRTRKMQGHKDIWEGHISQKYVFTFTIERDSETEEVTYIFRRIGTHDVYGKP